MKKQEFPKLDFQKNFRHRDSGTQSNNVRPGRPPKLPPSDKQYLGFLSLRDRRKT